MRMHEQQPRRLRHGRTLLAAATPSKVGFSGRYRFLAIAPMPRNAGGYYRQMVQLTRPAANVGRSRRRGEVLERALYEATLAEMAEVGYGRLTMEGIAARAHTGKAALYRRWASKHDLVHAALVFAVPPVPEP